LIIGDRAYGIMDFRGMLRQLSILPKGSVQTLNLICHCPDYLTLVFRRDFIFSEQSGETKAADPDPQDDKFSEVTTSELIELNTMDTIILPNELPIKLDDVRAAFAADGELRLYCMGDRAEESLAQALANLLQVRVISFTDSRIEFRTELIEGAEPAMPVKILATPPFSPNPFVFENFEQMVKEDASKTGRFIAYPRRP
jgi:hypothetical protein